jgi:hypothetical protein
MKRIHYILICCLLGLIGCSKQDECQCTKTRTEDGIVTEVTEYKVDAGDDGACRGRGWTDTINGVYVTEGNSCSKIQ